jgi:hypothetical protein
MNDVMVFKWRQRLWLFTDTAAAAAVTAGLQPNWAAIVNSQNIQLASLAGY